MTDMAPGGADGSARPGNGGSPADPGQLDSPGLTPAQARAEAAIEQALAGLGLVPERPQPGSFLVKLPGQHKLATMTWLIVSMHSLHVEAFFCRQPDEEHARFYRFLLEDHLSACVSDAVRRGGEEGQASVHEAAEAIARLVRS